MNRFTLRKSARTAIAAVLTAAMVGATSAAASPSEWSAPQHDNVPAANAAQSSKIAGESVLLPDYADLGNDEPPAAAPAAWPARRAGVSVYFHDYSIAFPASPTIVRERMMVPGAALLAGLDHI